jgi:hypothetical protein
MSLPCSSLRLARNISGLLGNNEEPCGKPTGNALAIRFKASRNESRQLYPMMSENAISYRLFFDIISVALLNSYSIEKA